VTDLPDNTIIKSPKEITDNEIKGVAGLSQNRGQQTKSAASKPKKPKGKKRSDASPRKEKPGASVGTEEAIGKIAAILAILPQEDRFAVLKKVNGAFGFKPKGKEGKATSHGGDKKPAPKPKSSFNEDFTKTLPGMILEETSRAMRQASKSTKEKVSSELYELHGYLLRTRAEVKEKKREFPVSGLDPTFDVVATTDGLLRSHKVITSAYAKAGLAAPSPEVIFTSGLCLLQGTVATSLPQEIGTIPDPDTWTEAPRTVPRTDEEAEARAAAIMASKKQRKQRKASEPDNQATARKRPKPNDPIAEETGAPGEAPGIQEMELEASPPTETHEDSKLPSSSDRKVEFDSQTSGL
jgi:hypothetical protein